jgi:hypothetical protein
MTEALLRAILLALLGNVGPEAAALGSAGVSFDLMIGR